MKNGAGEKKSTSKPETNGPSKVKEVNSDESVENKNDPFAKLDVLPPINGEANGEVKDVSNEESKIGDELVNGDGDEAGMVDEMDVNASAKVREGVVDGHVKETVEFFENLDKEGENVKTLPLDEAEMENNDVDMEKEDAVKGMPIDESKTYRIEVDAKKEDVVEFNNIMEEPSGEVNEDDNEYERTLGSPQVVRSDQDKVLEAWCA